MADDLDALVAEMRAMPTHEEHGESGFVTVRYARIATLLSALETAQREKSDRARMDPRKREPEMARQIQEQAVEIVCLRARIAELERDLHRISLASQNSMSSKDECGRIARAALAGVQKDADRG